MAALEVWVYPPKYRYPLQKRRIRHRVQYRLKSLFYHITLWGYYLSINENLKIYKIIKVSTGDYINIPETVATLFKIQLKDRTAEFIERGIVDNIPFIKYYGEIDLTKKLDFTSLRDRAPLNIEDYLVNKAEIKGRVWRKFR